jgi:hypothetical protein
VVLAERDHREAELVGPRDLVERGGVEVATRDAELGGVPQVVVEDEARQRPNPDVTVSA